MDAPIDSARAKAEARRAKILARQKDRLSTITGTYSSPAGDAAQTAPEQRAGAARAPAQPAAPIQAAGAAAAGPVTPAPPAAATGAEAVQRQQQPRPRVQQSQQPQPDQSQEQQMAALMQMLEQQLQHAQALGAPMPGAPEAQLRQRHAAAGAASRNGGGSARSQVSNGSNGSSGGASGLEAPADEQLLAAQPASQQVPLLLQLGPVLACSVKQTQLLRLLAALLLAYAALSGWQLPAPPVALLVLSDLAVVLAATALPQARSAAAAAAAAAAAGPAVPWRLRSLDLVSLVPGLRELLDSLAGYRAVTTAVSQDFAAYVVALGLLTAAGEAPGWYVPRLQQLL